MPQGWITRIEKDLGYISHDNGVTERPFRHWALAAEMGGRFPPVGSYVQYRELKDPQRGTYVTEVRQLTAPPPPSDGRHRNVYPDLAPPVEPGIARVLDGERVPLEQALREDAEAAGKTGVREAERPHGPLHAPMDLTWDLPDAPASENVNTLHDGHTVTVTAVSRPVTAATGEIVMTGTVKNIQADKRFGFLRGEDGSDRFFHASACDASVDFDALTKGAVVAFDHEDGAKGPRAVNVRRG